MTREAYLKSRVTPGRGAVSQTLCFKSRLITEDLPTFGYPTTAALTCTSKLAIGDEQAGTEKDTDQITI